MRNIMIRFGVELAALMVAFVYFINMIPDEGIVSVIVIGVASMCMLATGFIMYVKVMNEVDEYVAEESF